MMTIRKAVIGRNVEILDGPMLKGRRLGTLSVTEEGLHFRSRILVPPFSWHLAWEEVRDIQLGGDVAKRWSNVLPMKVAHGATHVTVTDVHGRQQGFVVPDVPQERVHNHILPTVPRWNGGRGALSE
jgi:hypothetical protein